MLRREARLRKEFLYRKALEEKDRKQQEQKLQLKNALDSNKPIPKELKRDAVKLAEALSYDQNVTGTALDNLHHVRWSHFTLSCRCTKQTG